MSMKMESQSYTSFLVPADAPSSGSSSDTPGGHFSTSPTRTKSSHTDSTANGEQSDSQGGLDYQSDVGYSSSAASGAYGGMGGGYGIPTHPSLYAAGAMATTSPPQHVGGSPPPAVDLFPSVSASISPQNPAISAVQNATISPTTTSAPGSTSTSATAGTSAATNALRRAAPSTPPVPLACTECRLRHLKCDAGVPTCGRCRSENRACSYIKSRRGWKGRKRKGTVPGVSGAGTGSAAQAGTTSQSEDNGSQAEDGKVGVGSGGALGGGGGGGGGLGLNGMGVMRGTGPLRSPDHSLPYTNPLDTVRNHYKGLNKFLSPQEHIPPAPTANLIQLYYAYFHAAHPFVLPPAYLIKTPAQMLKHLLPSMRFMGSFFAANANMRTFRDSAESSLFRQGAPRNAWTVQALLLFAIGLHANNEQERAGQVKDVAVEMALELGMNYEEFAVTAGVSGVSSAVPRRLTDEDFGRPPAPSAGGSNAILEESWRRTWWELYFLDGLMAGIHQRDQFRLWTVECTVPLPCEELAYNTGQVPEAFSLQEFDNRYFAAEDTVFSSFSYRVEAVRILGQVLAAQAAGSETDPADQSIVNWFLHLPEPKKELVGKDGKVDEMLFQAHMIIHATTIYLHRPRSHLVYSIIPDETACTPQPSTALSTSSKPQIFHTSRALKAADSISRLLTLPTPLIKHTPFFTCITTLASISHLSACSWILYGDEGYLAKERIRLAVGALKTLETAWPVASFVLSQVKLIAREVFRLPRPMGADGGGFISEEEMIRFIEEERAVDGVDNDVPGGFPGVGGVGWEDELRGGSSAQGAAGAGGLTMGLPGMGMGVGMGVGMESHGEAMVV